MKRFLVLILVAILIAPTIYAGDALEVIWQKNIWQQYTVEQAVFSKDGQWIYAAAGNHIYKIDVNTGEKVSEFNNEGLNDTGYMLIQNFDISDDGKYLMSIQKAKMYLWDIESETLIKNIQLSEVENPIIENGCFTNSIDEILIYVATFDQQTHKNYCELVLYDFQAESILKRVECNNYVSSITMSNTSNIFAIGHHKYGNTSDNSFQDVELWDKTSFSLIDVIHSEILDNGYKKLQFSDDDRYLGIFKQWDLHVYDLQDYSLVLDRGTWAFDFLPSSEIFYASYVENEGFSLNVFNFESNNLFKTIKSPISIISSCTYIADDNFVKIFGIGSDNTILLNYDTSVSVDEVGTTGTIQITQTEKNIIVSSNSEILKEISITDINGNTVYSISNLKTTNTSIQNDFPSCIYFVLIRTDKNEFVEKIMVVR